MRIARVDAQGVPTTLCPVFPLSWLAEGAVHAAIITFLPMAALGAGAVLPLGRSVGLWGYGLTVNLCVVIVANGRLGMENKLWTWLFAALFALSLALFVVSWAIFSEA